MVTQPASALALEPLRNPQTANNKLTPHHATNTERNIAMREVNS